MLGSPLGLDHLDNVLLDWRSQIEQGCPPHDLPQAHFSFLGSAELLVEEVDSLGRAMAFFELLLLVNMNL